MLLPIIFCSATIFLFTSAQDQFLGTKYVAVDNITAIDWQNSNNFAIIVSPSVTKYSANPLFTQDKPWEPRIDNGYPNVVFTQSNFNDNKLKNKTYQLWYDDFIQTQPSRIEATLYAQSIDGISWIKPSLHKNSFNNSTANNILFVNSGGLGIYKDIYTKNTNELYKAFGVLSSDISGIAVSKDGINWNLNKNANNIKYKDLSLNNRYDTHNNLFYDVNKTDKYILVTRSSDYPPRIVAMTNNSDTENNISPLQLNFTNLSFNNVKMVSQYSNQDNQTYAQITFPFHSIYLGLTMIYETNTNAQRVYCQLSYSIDLLQWFIIENQDLIPLSNVNSNDFDSHICFTAAMDLIVEIVIHHLV